MSRGITLSTPHTTTNRKGNSRELRHVSSNTRMRDAHTNTYVDKNRTPNNVEILTMSLIDVYDRINTRWDADIKDYDSTRPKTRDKWVSFTSKTDTFRGNASNVYHEIVFAYGSSFDMRVDDDNPTLMTKDNPLGNVDIGGSEWSRRAKALTHFGNTLEELLPEFCFYNITLHLDEANPHLHALYVIHTEAVSASNKRMTHNTADAYSNIIKRTGFKWTDEYKPTRKDRGDFSKVFNGYLHKELIDTYNKVNPKHPVRKIEQRDKDKSRTMHEFKNIIQPVQDLAFKMFSLYVQQQEYTKKLELLESELKKRESEINKRVSEVSTYLDDSQKQVVESLLNDIHADITNTPTLVDANITSEVSDILNEIQEYGIQTY